jgi:hypothetical protein
MEFRKIEVGLSLVHFLDLAIDPQIVFDAFTTFLFGSASKARRYSSRTRTNRLRSSAASFLFLARCSMLILSVPRSFVRDGRLMSNMVCRLSPCSTGSVAFARTFASSTRCFTGGGCSPFSHTMIIGLVDFSFFNLTSFLALSPSQRKGTRTGCLFSCRT